LESIRPKREPYRRRFPSQQLHPACRVEEGLLGDGEAVWIARRDELAVVGKLALDQAGREAGRAHLEAGFELAQPQDDLVGPGQEPGELAEGARGHEHLLALVEDRRAR